MQTSIYAKIKKPNLPAIKNEVMNMVLELKSYLPGYELLVAPTIESNVVITTIKVIGAGDYLPPYAGNLDIINCAAIAIAERMAKNEITVK